MMVFVARSTLISESFLCPMSAYLYDEHSFLPNEDSDVSLMTGHHYVSLDVSLQTNRITGVSGYIDLSYCVEKELVLLKGENGQVDVTSDLFFLESGIGYEYPIAGESYVDQTKKIVQIGEVDEHQKNIRISINIVLGLLNQRITCIQIQLI